MDLRRRLRLWLTLLMVGGALLAPIGAAIADLVQQREQLSAASSSLKAAQRFIRKDRGEEALDAYKEAQAALSKIKADGVEPRLERLIERADKQLAKLRERLVKAGLQVPAASAADSSKPSGRFAAGEASFVRDVAPMLVAKCKGCHIDNQRGGFSLATYQLLMRGSEDSGRVITPGEGVGSVLVDLIASGDMPRGGGKVSPQELTKLINWINAGAKFDGENPNSELTSLKVAAGADSTMVNPSTVRRPTGSETVSFSREIAPLFSKKCGDCHVLNNRGRFQMASYKQLLDQGAIVAGDPDKSSLVRRLRGDVMPRMPLRRSPLSEAEITLVSTWVKEGMVFDGADPGMGLDRVNALAVAASSTPEERSQSRASLAERTWKLALPDEEASQEPTEHYLLVSNSPSKRLAEIKNAAESARRRVVEWYEEAVGPVKPQPRQTLFVTPLRIDFAEFGQMVERRPLPEPARSYWKSDLIDAYAVLLDDNTDAGIDTAWLIEPIAALLIAEQTEGRIPRWAVSGAARQIAIELAGKSPTVERWRSDLASALEDASTPARFLTAEDSPAMQPTLPHAFLAAVWKRPGSFEEVMAKVASGTEFPTAFRAVYGSSVSDLAKSWAAAVKRR